MAGNQVLFLGHSHACCLEEFVNGIEGQRKGRVNFNFPEALVRVTITGEGGMKLDHLVNHYTQYINEVRPHTLVLLIGDNDLKKDCTGEELALKMIAAATNFKKVCVSIQQIVFSQFLPHYQGAWGDIGAYNSKALSANNTLLNEVKSDLYKDYMFFLRSGFDFPGTDQETYIKNKRFFRDDGVHLTPQGVYKLYRVLRSAVGNAI